MTREEVLKLLKKNDLIQLSFLYLKEEGGKINYNDFKHIFPIFIQYYYGSEKLLRDFFVKKFNITVIEHNTKVITYL